jgi:Tol biopolymer transport system component
VCLCGVLALFLAACGQAGYGPAAYGPVTTEGLALSWSPDGKWMVFPASTNQNPPELYALNVTNTLEGAGRDSWVHLSQGFFPAKPDAFAYMQLAWSPDGRKIAFTAGDTAYVFDAACLEKPAECADSLTPVIGGASAWSLLEWSPDSRTILLQSTIAGPLVNTDKGMMADKFVMLMRVVAADGSGEVFFSRATKPRQAPDWTQYASFSPAWSPDGKQILYRAGQDGSVDLYLLTLEGEQVRQLTHTPEVEELGPTWSPDGKLIAYGVNHKNRADLYTLAIDGGSSTCVTCDIHPSWKHMLLWFSWSPDGRHIAYTITGKPRLFQKAVPYYTYLINPDGSQQVPVVKNGYPGLTFWSPDGRRLAFGFRPRSPLESLESDILVINADGSGLTNLTD